MGIYQKVASGAFNAVVAGVIVVPLASCLPEDDDSKPDNASVTEEEVYLPQIQPNLTISFQDRQSMSQEPVEKTKDVYIIDISEIRDFIRAREGLGQNDDVEISQYPEIVTEYVDHKLQVYGYSFFFQPASRANILQRLLNNQAVFQPAAWIVGDKASIIIDADTSLNAREWVSQWTEIPIEEISQNHGISDIIFEDFIRYHEIAHTVGADEPNADAFATSAIVNEYGLTEEVLKTLYFLSDSRLVGSNNALYWGTSEAISTIYSFQEWHWPAEFNYFVLSEENESRDERTLQTYSPFAFARKDDYYGHYSRLFGSDIFEGLKRRDSFDAFNSHTSRNVKSLMDQLSPRTIVYDFNSDGVDRRGLPTCVRGPCSQYEYFEGFLAAIERLNTLRDPNGSFYYNLGPEDFHLESWVEGPSEIFFKSLENGLKPRSP